MTQNNHCAIIIVRRFLLSIIATTHEHQLINNNHLYEKSQGQNIKTVIPQSGGPIFKMNYLCNVPQHKCSLLNLAKQSNCLDLTDHVTGSSLFTKTQILLFRGLLTQNKSPIN